MDLNEIFRLILLRAAAGFELLPALFWPFLSLSPAFV
jgi:hypothetical protein